MKYRELVYMCLDEIKLASDDSYITEDHILFLISKYRAFLLRQKYDKTVLPVAESNYQKIQVSADAVIPDVMGIAKPRVYVGEGSNKTLYTFVTPHRFEFVSDNRILKPISYCTINDANKLEFKKKSPDSGKTINLYAVFEDCVKASEFNCEGDVLDEECPIEAELVSGVQELVVKDALGIAYRPTDFVNNAADDLSKLGMAVGNSKK